MHRFHTKVSGNGRVIIPACIRKELDIKSGDEVIISKMDDGNIKISTAKHALKKLQEMVAGKNIGTAQLFEMRKSEVL